MILAGPLITRASFLYAAVTTVLQSATLKTLSQNDLSSSPPSFLSSPIDSSSVTTNYFAINPKNHEYSYSSSYDSIPNESMTEKLQGITEGEYQKMIQLGANIVRNQISQVIQSDPTVAGSLLRLSFHDAATRDTEKGIGGPNGSIIYEIDDRNENRGLSKPMSIVRSIATEVYGLDISLADTIALAGAAAVECSGGPYIGIKLGRPDVEIADPAKLSKPIQGETDRSKVETTLPGAGLDSDGLRLYFNRLGFSEAEWVALCGAHDLGRHVTLLGMPKSCLKKLTRECLEDAPVSLPFVTQNPDTFSNLYFQKLLDWNDQNVKLGEVQFIPTDVSLVVDEGLRKYVERFAENQVDFFQTFTTAYQKLVDVSATSSERY